MMNTLKEGSLKNITAEDIIRIEREIVYSFPARRADGLIRCEGKYGDLVITGQAKDLTDSYGMVAQQAFPRLLNWMLSRVNDLMSGEKFIWSKGWTIVDGKPAKPRENSSEPASLACGKCMGTNCHAGTHDASIPHSLQCLEESHYTFSNQPAPDALQCEALVDGLFELGATGALLRLPVHLKRVAREKHQLDEKISKLSSFFETGKFKALSAKEGELLTTQLSCMREYSDLLTQRLAS